MARRAGTAAETEGRTNAGARKLEWRKRRGRGKDAAVQEEVRAGLGKDFLRGVMEAGLR